MGTGEQVHFLGCNWNLLLKTELHDQTSHTAVHTVFQQSFPGQAFSPHFCECICISWRSGARRSVSGKAPRKIEATVKTPPKCIHFKEEQDRLTGALFYHTLTT